MGLVITNPGSGYTTAAKARSYAGLTTADADDTLLGTLIIYCSRGLSRDITTRRFGERLVGQIDGVNLVFQTAYRYIADRDVNLVVNGSDVTVRGVKVNTDGSKTLTTLGVASIDSFAGKVTLSVAPTSSLYDYLEIDYESYHAPVYSDQLEEAANALVAHLVWLRNRVPGGMTVAQLKGLGSAGGLEMLNGHAAFSAGSRWLAQYMAVVQRIRTGKLRGGE